MSLTRWFRTILGLLALAVSLESEAGTLRTNHIQVRGARRMFIVHEPARFDTTAQPPVLFMFHGLRSSAWEVAREYNLSVTSDENGFLAVFPEARIPPERHIRINGTTHLQSYDASGKRWDIAHILNGSPQTFRADRDRCDSPDLDFVELMIEWLADNYNIDRSRVYATGHSYGAFFGYYCAVCLEDRIAAFASHSGGLFRLEDDHLGVLWWPIEVPTGSRISGLIIHSPGDSTVAYTNGTLLYKELIKADHDAEFITLPEFLTHTWDSTKNQLQWDFFIQHRLPHDRLE